jgi:hypothetical protein
MTYDAGLVARIADLLPAAEIRTARQKNVFGGRGFLLGKSTFVIAWGDGLLVKTPRADYPAALARPGVTPFAPDGESPMGTWVLVPADLLADDPDLLEWLSLAARSIR